MATSETADPRWIVNDLGKVGTNVGRWHWTEQHVIGWCKKRLAELLENQIFYSTNNIECKFTTVHHVKGDATVANRKRKLITFYQLDVSVGWKAVLKKEESATITAKGNINMPYISDENDLDDFEIQITLDSEGSASTEQKELKDLVRTHSSEKLKLLIVKFLQELKAGADVAEKYKEWEQEMERLEREGKLSNSQKAKPVASGTSLSKKLLEEENKKVSNANIMKTVVLKENLRGPVPMIFDYFLDSNKVSIITRAKASIEKKVGGKVEMFNGQVIGEILELEENKKIVQKWRFRDWEGDHWSRLILTFEPQGDMTLVTLTQTDIPSSQEKRVEGGWNNIFNGMKVMLGQVISSGF